MRSWEQYGAGDITAHTAAGAPLRDLAREVDRGRELWFVQCPDELGHRMNGPAGS